MRHHTVADFEPFADLWADPGVVRHILGTPSSRADSWRRLLRQIGHWQALGFGYWTVEDREDGRFLGTAGFADHKREMVPPLGADPEAGWVLAPHAQGRGVATEAMTTALAWLDAHHPARRSVCIVAPDNAISQRVAAKLGYRPAGEGILDGDRTLIMARPRRVER